MIQRWKEIHQKTLPIEKEFNKYYLPYLLLDEYLNTLKYMSSIKVTKEEMKDIYNIFSTTKKETILYSPILTKRIKRNIIDFINNPYSYYKKAQTIAYIKTPFKKVIDVSFSKGTKRREILKKYLLLTTKNYD